MIYEVYIDDQLLYYPNDETYVIYNAKLDLALDEAGSFEFDIPEYNLRFNDFKLRDSIIRITQNNNEIFCGEVREVVQNFDFTKHVYCVGELAGLFDSIQPQACYQCSPREMLQKMLDIHNQQVIVKDSTGKLISDRKAFYLDNVASTDIYVYHYTNREDTLTCIRSKLCEKLDLHIKIRKINGKKYISLIPLVQYGSYCQQQIEFGENLLDYSKNMTAQDIATACIPLGARIDDEERTNNAVEGLDEYLTISGTNVNEYHKTADSDYVQIDSAVNTYGFVSVVHNWNDVTLKDNLQEKAIEWLKTAQYENMTLELKALDKNLLDANIDSFDIGDTIHVWAKPFEMDAVYPVKKKTIYLNDLSKNTVILGGKVQKGFTTQASNAVASLKEDIPDVSPLLAQAKANALALLLAQSTGGHVVYEFDETNSYIEAINVCNNSTIKSSTRRWVWNLNGFGFMTRDEGYIGTDDGWNDLKVAMTMQGEIVADFITAGTMTADRIRGGELEVGGKGFAQNGSIQVKDENNNVLVKLDKTGMTLSKDQKISWDNVDGADGKVTSITKNTVNTAYVNSLGITAEYVKAGAVSASDITAGTMSGSRISGGTISGVSITSSNNIGGNSCQFLQHVWVGNSNSNWISIEPTCIKFYQGTTLIKQI